MVKRKLRLPRRKLQLPLRYPKPPPDDHLPLITVKSCGWAFELKKLVYFYNPEVKSVRIVAEYPEGVTGDSYEIVYTIKVKPPELVSLRRVLLNAIRRYPFKLQQRCYGLAHESLGL